MSDEASRRDAEYWRGHLTHVCTAATRTDSRHPVHQETIDCARRWLDALNANQLTMSSLTALLAVTEEMSGRGSLEYEIFYLGRCWVEAASIEE